MKRTFEFILIVIIFYGVYDLFAKIAQYFFKEMDQAFIVLISFIISGTLLFIYRFILTHEVKTKMKGKVHALHNALKEKDQVIKEAKSFKETLIKEAEASKEVE